MTTTAVVFPGQGSQHPGMGRAFYEAWPETRERLDALSRTLGDDVARLCFEADADEQRRTGNAQPALFGLGLAVYEALVEQTGLDPDYLAGHSLGQFTALGAAGALDPAEGVRLTRRRGELLAEAGREAGPGRMVAVLLADPDTVAAACTDRTDVSVGLYNGPRQTVISGTDAGVAAVRERLDADPDVDARFRELDVAAAFHSPVMASARPAVDQVMADAELSRASAPVVSDVRCEPYRDPEVAREDLSDQVTAPVDWRGVVERLSDLGVDRYVAVPPAETLAALVERIDPDAAVVALESPSDAAALAPEVEASDD